MELASKGRLGREGSGPTWPQEAQENYCGLVRMQEQTCPTCTGGWYPKGTRLDPMNPIPQPSRKAVAVLMEESRRRPKSAVLLWSCAGFRRWVRSPRGLPSSTPIPGKRGSPAALTTPLNVNCLYGQMCPFIIPVEISSRALPASRLCRCQLALPHR